MEQVIEMCRRAVADIIEQVGGVGDLLLDDKKRQTVSMILERMDALGADINTILGPELANAYMAGMDEGDAFLEQEGVDAKLSGVNRRMHLAGVESIVADTMLDLGGAINTAKALAIDNIDSILASVQEDIAKGIIVGDSSKVVAQAVQHTFAKNGMTAFITKDGKELPLDFYAQTVTRTKMRVAQTTGAVNRYKESGVNHIKVDEHSGTCAVCARYQGKVLALTPDDSGFPVADSDIPLPPYHPNCRHTARAYVMDYHSDNDIAEERKKWAKFNPTEDVRSDDEKELYRSEQSIRRKAKQEEKEYLLIKSALGDDAPKTLSAYRRMRRKGDDNWKALQQRYQDAVEAVDGMGPPKGTPRRKRKASTPPPQPSNAPTAVVPPIETAPAPTPSDNEFGLSSGVELARADKQAVEVFDNLIDKLDFTGDRRKYMKKLIEKSDYFVNKDMQVSVAKLKGAWGQVEAYIVRDGYDSMKQVSRIAVEKNDSRPAREQLKTIFHEFYHANTHNTEVDRDWALHMTPDAKKYATLLEEVFTESSAQFMLKRAGYPLDDIVPSYGAYLGQLLPQLKKMERFSDCVDVADFGAKLMRYRFSPQYQTARLNDFLDLMRADGLEPFTNAQMGEYLITHYGKDVLENLDYYADRVLNAQGDYWEGEKDARLTRIHGIITDRLKQSIEGKRYNAPEFNAIMGVAINRNGVK